jgi:methionine synthase II (cobalamin-independent)
MYIVEIHWHVSNLNWKQDWHAIEMYIVEIHWHVSNLNWKQDWHTIEMYNAKTVDYGNKNVQC